MPKQIERLGWLPDVPDQRDHFFELPQMFSAMTAQPATIDLRKTCPPIYDQGRLGSCVGNATGFAYAYDVAKQKVKKKMTPSRLFLYYNARVAIQMENQDSGCMIRDAFKSLSNEGVCDESIWPYDIAKFAEKPPAAAYSDGLKHRAVNYARLTQDIRRLKGCIAYGLPFVFGIAVYESFSLSKGRSTAFVA